MKKMTTVSEVKVTSYSTNGKPAHGYATFGDGFAVSFMVCRNGVMIWSEKTRRLLASPKRATALYATLDALSIEQTDAAPTDGDSKPLSNYQRIIKRLAPEVTDPAGIEAHMRLEYGTLDHLDEGTFTYEIGLAMNCERHQPGYLRSVAASFGM